jgi:capsular polysaccharide biosynthesis protein
MLFYRYKLIDMTKFIKNSIISQRNLPVNIKSEDMYLFAHEQKKNLPKPKTKNIKNVLIVNNTIIGFKYPKFFFRDTFFENAGYKKIIKDTFKNLIRNKKKVTVIQKASWILDNKSSVYFHFICDALTRATFIDDFTENYPVLLTKDFIDKSYVYDILKFLEIPSIQMEDNYYYVKELLLTSHTAPSGNYNPNIIKKLSSKFTLQHDYKEIGNRRIWIDRKGERRDIKNWEEVLEILKKFKFEVINFREYNIHEKNKLLMNTEFLMGVFGSGLTNMVMLPKKAKVIELRNKRDSHNNAFFSLASELDLPYYYFQVDVVGHITHGDVVIDTSKFEKFLISIFGKSF